MNTLLENSTSVPGLNQQKMKLARARVLGTRQFTKCLNNFKKKAFGVKFIKNWAKLHGTKTYSEIKPSRETEKFSGM